MDPNRLLDDWAARYRFDRHRRHRYAVSIASYEQGMRKIQNELKRNHVRFAWTGWSAAQLVAPYVRTEMFMAYVDLAHQDPVFRAMQPVEDGGNVLLLEPHDEGVFQFDDSSSIFGSLVCLPQLYIDLRNMSGRAAEQADAVREKKLRFESRTHA